MYPAPIRPNIHQNIVYIGKALIGFKCTCKCHNTASMLCDSRSSIKAHLVLFYFTVGLGFLIASHTVKYGLF